MAARLVGVIAEAFRTSKSKWTALPRYVWRITNDMLETNSKRLVETHLGNLAPIVNALLIDPVIEGNTNRAREAEELYNMIRKSGITRENSAIAHLYAEQRITQGELMAFRPKDYKQIIEGVKVFSSIYERVYNEVNEVLTKNGFAPVEHRANYFPHFRTGANPILVMLGMVEDEDTLPIDIAGRTEDFKPSKQFVGNFLARMGDKTDFGLLEGAVRYLNGALQVIHQTDNIVRLRQIEEFMGSAGDLNGANANANFQDFKNFIINYADSLAGKKSKMDRVGEHMIKRRGLSFLRHTKLLRGLATTAYNVNTLLAQLTAIGQAIGLAPYHTALAFSEMLASAANGKGFDFITANEALSSFLTRKYKGRPIPITALEIFAEKGQIGTETAERLVSNLFVRAIYLQGLGKKLSEQAAMERADEWAYRMLTSRLRGESGIEYNSTVGGILLQFTREGMNNWFSLIKDIPRHTLAKGIPAMLLIALYNWLLNWATGSNVALDPIGQGIKAANNREEDEQWWQTAGKAIWGTFDTGWPIQFDFVNGAQGVPLVAGARNFGNAVKGMFWGDNGLTFNWQDPVAWEKMISTAMGLTLPGAAQIERAYRGTKAYIKGYSESNNGQIRFVNDQSPDDLVVGVLLGELSTKEGREYRARNGQPLSDSQDAQVRAQIAGGKKPIEAFRNVTGTRGATTRTNYARDLKMQGDIEGSKEMERAAAEQRSQITFPAETPQWAISLHSGDDPSATAILQRVSDAWHESGILDVFPKKTPGYIQYDGKQLPLDNEEIIAKYEAEYEKNYMAALRYLLSKNENATAREIAEAANRASAMTRRLFIKYNWPPKKKETN